ncbi:hypothetical protein LPJ66_003124, partial [Kickxella alabastrina]
MVRRSTRNRGKSTTPAPTQEPTQPANPTTPEYHPESTYESDPNTATTPPPAPLDTSDPQRPQALHRLISALRNGDFDSDTDEQQNEEPNEPGLDGKEKKLMLRFRKSKLQDGQPLRVEDIDWPEFDTETINEILRRREELQRQRCGEKINPDVRTAELKKSSLAPATTVQSARMDEDEMDVDEREHFRDLFDDTLPAIATAPSNTALHLPARALAPTDTPSEPRPHPALIRTTADATMGAGLPKDMRLVLQYELRREESLLKDLRAEIVDKLFKLQAEEKLLRMIVRDEMDVDQQEEEEAAAAAGGAAAAVAEEGEVMGASGYGGGFGEIGDGRQLDYVAAAAAAAAAVAAAAASGQGMDEDSDDASSLSGMSSSSSEDEVQDEELERGALKTALS